MTLSFCSCVRENAANVFSRKYYYPDERLFRR
jgi:hypothetical protein